MISCEYFDRNATPNSCQSLDYNLCEYPINVQRAEKRILNARIKCAKFLQETALEMAKEVQRSRVGEVKRAAKDLDEFLNRVSENGPCIVILY